MPRKPELFCKVAKSFWADAKVRRLSPDQKLLWLFILTGPHQMGLPGLYRFSVHTVLEAFPEWDFAQVCCDLEVLAETGMIEHDQENNVLWLPNAIDFHAPPSVSNIESWRRHFDQVPESPLRTRWIEALHAHCSERAEEIEQHNATVTKESDRRNPLPWRELQCFADVAEVDRDPPGDPSPHPGGDPSPRPMEMEIKREREREMKREIEETVTVCAGENADAVIAVVGQGQITEIRQDGPSPRQIEALRRVQSFTDRLEEHGRKAGFPPGVLEALFGDFIQAVEERRPGMQTFTLIQRADFAKRMNRLPIRSVLYALEVFIDEAPSTADERYAVGTADKRRNVTDDEMDADYARHRRKHPNGWLALFRASQRKAQV